ncbi:MAG: hypothetical protein OXU45_07425 [Candidatus Melainabacteria bacterium]|nr:hypothetical protein [Candidatus Melainabacteria bacterium]
MFSRANNQVFQLSMTASSLAERYIDIPGAADEASQGAGEASSGQWAPNPVHELFIRDLASVAQQGAIPQLASKIFGVLYQSRQAGQQAGNKGHAHAMRAQAQQILKEMGKKYKEIFREYSRRKAENLQFVAISKWGEITAQRQFGASVAGSKGMSAQLRDSMTTLANDFNSTPADPYVNIVNAVS